MRNKIKSFFAILVVCSFFIGLITPQQVAVATSNGEYVYDQVYIFKKDGKFGFLDNKGKSSY